MIIRIKRKKYVRRVLKIAVKTWLKRYFKIKRF